MSELHQIADLSEIKEGSKAYKRLQKLRRFIAEIEKHPVPEEISELINQQIDVLNAHHGTQNQVGKAILRCQRKLLDLAVRKLKLTPRNYHRNVWTGLGMAVFGVPLGISFGLSMQNMGLLGIGIPVGLVIGIALGAAMDRKAKERGNQLDVDMIY
ncbi:MAG: hypothetical protein RLP15_13970 [Cryomorphaceae bacterium]